MGGYSDKKGQNLVADCWSQRSLLRLDYHRLSASLISSSVLSKYDLNDQAWVQGPAIGWETVLCHYHLLSLPIWGTFFCLGMQMHLLYIAYLEFKQLDVCSSWIQCTWQTHYLCRHSHCWHKIYCVNKRFKLKWQLEFSVGFCTS